MINYYYLLKLGVGTGTKEQIEEAIAKAREEGEIDETALSDAETYLLDEGMRSAYNDMVKFHLIFYRKKGKKVEVPEQQEALDDDDIRIAADEETWQRWNETGPTFWQRFRFTLLAVAVLVVAALYAFYYVVSSNKVDDSLSPNAMAMPQEPVAVGQNPSVSPMFAPDAYVAQRIKPGEIKDVESRVRDALGGSFEYDVKSGSDRGPHKALVRAMLSTPRGSRNNYYVLGSLVAGYPANTKSNRVFVIEVAGYGNEEARLLSGFTFPSSMNQERLDLFKLMRVGDRVGMFGPMSRVFGRDGKDNYFMSSYFLMFYPSSSGRHRAALIPRRAASVSKVALISDPEAKACAQRFMETGDIDLPHCESKYYSYALIDYSGMQDENRVVSSPAEFVILEGRDAPQGPSIAGRKFRYRYAYDRVAPIQGNEPVIVKAAQALAPDPDSKKAVPRYGIL